MNKEKLILDTIKEKAYGVNAMQHPVYGHGRYDMAYEILDEVQKIIQSEPEEKTNFDVITKTPAKMINYFIYLMRQISEENGHEFEVEPETIEKWIDYLNQKAGE